MAAFGRSSIATGTSVQPALHSFQNATNAVKCFIEIENHSNVELIYDQCFINKGCIGSTPSNIAPRHREAFHAHWDGFIAGSSGVASWIIGGTGKRMVIMWSVPYGLSLLYSNKLAVGFSDFKIDHRIFNQMHFEQQTWFERGSYYQHCKELTHSDAGFTVEGSMGTNYSPMIKVRFNCT